MARFVAFYSYKGGVGRSLALANVAYALAARGKRVIAVDMDLEAPALHTYDGLKREKGRPRVGLIDYAASYARRGRCPKIKRYVYRCRVEDGHGRLWVMPAGRVGGEYSTALGDLRWRRLHPRKGSEPFVAELRRALVEEYRPHYVLIDARTGLSDVGGLSTHRLADAVVLVFNLTRACLEGTVRAYRSITGARDPAPDVTLVASMVPPGDVALVAKRLESAASLMPLGVRFGRPIIRLDYDPAMALAETLAVRQPDRFAAAGRYEQLREILQRANPAEVFPAVEEARQLRSEGRIDEAVERLRAFTGEHAEDADGHLALGELLLETGRAREAVDALREAVRRAPELALAHRRLGEALLAAGDGTGAVEALRAAAQRGDQSREVHQALAEAYARTGDARAEMDARRRAIVSVLGPERPLPSRARVPLGDLRREFIDLMRREPPFMGFDAEAFWVQVMGSLSLSPADKRRLVHRLVEGTMAPSAILQTVRSLEREHASLRQALGPGVDDLQSRMAADPRDPHDPDAMLTLRRGDAADATLLTFCATRLALPAERRIELLRQAVDLDPERRVAIRALTKAALDERSPEGREARIREVVGRLAEAARRAPRDASLLNDLGAACVRLADVVTEVGESRRWLDEACRHFEQAARLDAHSAIVLYNWGCALQQSAALVAADERIRLLRLACDCYRDAVERQPEHDGALFNWGNTLVALAGLDARPGRERLLREACERYEEAVRLSPRKFEALTNWGHALRELSRSVSGPTRTSLLRESCARYEEVVRHKPEDALALAGWTAALIDLAHLADDSEREATLARAGQVLGEARFHGEGNAAALSNLAGALLRWAARSRDPDERRRLLREAEHLAGRANALAPHAGDYNLACAKALLGELDEAWTILAGHLERRPFMGRHALDDRDLAPLWTQRPDLRARVATAAERKTPDTAGHAMNGGGPGG